MNPTMTIVFDLDGVLVDSRHQMTVALAESYRRHVGSGEPPYEAFFARMGMPLPEILGELGLPADMASTYRDACRRSPDLVTAFPGMRALLDFVRWNGVTLGLMTGKDRARTTEALRRFGFDRALSALVCGDDPFRGKPDPEGLVYLLSVLDADPERTAFVGDSPLDMTCACAAGVMAVGAEWGVGTAEELRAAGAQATVASPGALRAWIRQAQEQLEEELNDHLQPVTVVRR